MNQSLTKNSLSTRFAFSVLFLLWFLPRIHSQELPPPAQTTIDFDEHVQPILKKACIRCHGPKRQRSSFRLDSREAVLKGGEIGKAVVLGNSAESALIRYVSGLDEDVEMPPSGDPLTKEQIGLLRAWIDQGLQWTVQEVVKVVKPAEERVTLKGKSERVHAVAFANGTGRLASAGGQSLPLRPGEVTLWDVSTGNEITRLDDPKSLVWSVAFSPDGKRLAAGTYNKIVKIWDVDRGKVLATLEGHQNWVTAVGFSPDGTLLASGSEDSTVKLWSVESGAEVATLKGHAATVRSLAFSPDGSELATGSQDKTVKLWDLATRSEKKTLEGHEDSVLSVAYSPDGKSLVSASADRTLRQWRLVDGKQIKKLSGHKNWVVSVAYSPKGKLLASGGYDNAVKLWDISTGVEIRSLPGHQGAVWSVAFSPDGDTLASGSQDGTVKLWDVGSYRDRKFMRF